MSHSLWAAHVSSAVPMDCSMSGFSVLHHLLEIAQTHAHWVSDAIQTSHPLSSSLPVLNDSQHQGTFQWVGSSNRLPEYWRFSFSIRPSNEYSGFISFRIDWIDLFAIKGALKSLLQYHSSKHQFFSTKTSLWSNCHIHTWLLEKPYLWLDRLVGKVMYLFFFFLFFFFNILLWLVT